MDGSTGLQRAAVRLFDAIGLEVHRRRSRHPRRSMGEVLAHLKAVGLNPATVFDIGVGYGTAPLYEAFPDARLVLIEPLTEFLETLEKLARARGATVVMAAAGGRSGATTVHVSPYLEGSSVLVETVDIGGVVDRQVPMVTIDDSVARMELSGPYLLKLDVQGGELQALDGAARTLQATDAVILEVSLFRFMQNGPEFFDVVAYMRARDFVVYDIFGGHLRPLDRALAQIDLAFVKEQGPFRRSHAYRLV